MALKYLNEIVCGDSLKLIEELPDNSIDLVVTSPPYNLDLGNNKFHKLRYDVYDDNKPYDDYISGLKNIFAALYKKLKSGGRLCINIGDADNGAIPVHSDIIQFMVRDLPYLLISQVIWNKNNAANRCAWGSWKSPQHPSFPSPYEFVQLYAKETKQKVFDGPFINEINKNWEKFSDIPLTNKQVLNSEGIRHGKKKYAIEEEKKIKKVIEEKYITVSKDEFVTNTWGIWNFAPETRQKKMGHGAMFPLELPRRCIQTLSYKGDVVLDPFNGLGTTCVAAKELGRNYIGFDMSEKYCEISKVRIKHNGKFPDVEKSIGGVRIPSVLVERMKWQDNA